MGLGITFPDENEQVLLEGVDTISEMRGHENRHYDRVASIISRTSYHFLFMYGLLKGVFSQAEIEAHVSEHGFGFSNNTNNPSDFDNKVMALIDEPSTLSTIQMFMDASKVGILQSFATGIVFSEENDESFAIVPIATPIFA